MPTFTYQSDEPRDYPAIADGDILTARSVVKGAEVDADSNPDPSRFVPAKPLTAKQQKAAQPEVSPPADEA